MVVKCVYERIDDLDGKPIVKFVYQCIDDLDGKPIVDVLGREFKFSYQGANYRIDLRPQNADKIEAAFAPFLAAAAKVPSADKPT